MSKIECPSCAMEVDSDHETCPICGYEFPKRSKGFQIVAIILAVLLLLFFIF